MRINTRGFIGTVTVHSLLLALLLLGGLTFPDPPPEEQGVLVNFGTDDTGMGFIEPEGDESELGGAETGPTEEITEPFEEPAVSTPPVSDNKPVDNTQEVEEVVVKEDPGPTAEELRRQEEEAERNRIQEEQERQRLLEEERIRQEQEAERKRLEEEQRRRDEQANRLNDMGRNTFGRQGVGETDGTEGEQAGTGTNQGTITGSPDAPNYGEGSGLGDGPSYGLGSRNAVGQLPLPNVDDCNVTSRVIVTVEIQVDRDGNVISASVQSATFQDNCIWSVVVEAARRTKFNADQNAAFRQSGWIRYTIEP